MSLVSLLTTVQRKLRQNCKYSINTEDKNLEKSILLNPIICPLFSTDIVYIIMSINILFP